jgi:hypothetical protein
LEGFVEAAGILVYPLSDALLSGAVFADQQDRNGVMPQFADHGHYGTHAWASLKQWHIGEFTFSRCGRSLAWLEKILYHD